MKEKTDRTRAMDRQSEERIGNKIKKLKKRTAEVEQRKNSDRGEGRGVGGGF